MNVDCAGHSVVLAIKPVYRRICNLTGTLVRLGHILEGGRCAQSFAAECAVEVEEMFDFREVREWPAEFDQWRAHARTVLRRSRGAGDLTLADEENILAADNGDWNDERLVHYCIGDVCPLKCNGSRVNSLTGVTGAVTLSVGSGYKTSLEYRWKGMETMSCKTYRGRAEHGILDRVLTRLHPQSAVAKAHAQVSNRGDQDIAPSTKRHVKGGAVLAEFQKDPQNKIYELAVIVAQPAQHFLNHIFTSEKAHSQATQDGLTTSSSSNVFGWTEAQLNSMRSNTEIFSGRRGNDVVAAYTRMVKDFNDDGWDQCSLTSADKQEHCAGLLESICDAEQRLV